MPKQRRDKAAMLLCLTGGGTAGHVTPHFALMPLVRARGWRVFYIGSNGIERSLVEAEGIEFHQIAAGKLRRYLSFKNVVDVFKVAWGCVQAFSILVRRRPDAVFSKGGFVAVPVAVAAWLLRIPVISHESDLTPGLANRLIAPFARRIAYTFADTAKYLGPDAVHVGTPVREELFQGERTRGLALCGFDPAEDRPTLLVMGGSQGAQRINEAMAEALPELLQEWRVIHLTGAGKELNFTHPRYKGFAYVRGELKDLMAAADFFMGRAGANSIFEVLALGKPMLLIPLEVGSRGDQVLNANAFARHGWAMVLRETELDATRLKSALTNLRAQAASLRAAQASAPGRDAAERMVEVIADAAGGTRRVSPA